MSLYIVATPIGNLEDITLRAVRILQEAELILCEDTRHSHRLLDHYDIRKPALSYHDFNKEKVTAGIVEKLLAGQNIALISDAGTPGISDPAFYLVRHALRENIQVIPIPGPSAVISALVVSGLPTDKFHFEGFLPVKKGRKTRLEKLNDIESTIVLYESPHKILKTLENLKSYLGNRRVCIGREITKMHEEFYRGTIDDVLDEVKPKGEFTLVLEGRSAYTKRVFAESSKNSKP